MGLLDALWQMQPDYIRNAGGNLSNNIGGLLSFLGQGPQARGAGLSDNAPDLSVYGQPPSGGIMSAQAAPAPMQPAPFGGSPLSMTGFGPQLGPASMPPPAPPPQAAPMPQAPAPDGGGNPLGGIGDYLGGVAHRLALMSPTAQALQPKFGQIGQDSFGNPQYGWINAGNQTVTPIAGNASSTMADQAVKAGLTGEDYLKAIGSPAMANDVRKLASGEMQMNSRMQNTPQGRMLIAHALNYDPTFNAQDVNARYNLKQSFIAGKDADTNRAQNQTMQHGLRAARAIDEENNFASGPAIMNPLRNATVGQFSTQLQDARGRVGQAAAALGNEAATVFKGAGQTHESEIKAFRGVMSDPDASIVTKRAALSEMMNLIDGAMQARRDKLEKGMGRPLTSQEENLVGLSPGAKKAFEQLKALDTSNGLQGAGAAPANAGAIPNRIGSKAEYDKLPSGAEFTGPDGKPYRKP